MEAILVTTITVVGSIVSAVLSLIVDRKLRDHNSKTVDLANHYIFACVEKLMRENMLCTSVPLDNFLKKWLELNLRNLHALVNYENIESLSPSKCKRVMHDFVHGLNSFSCVTNCANYDAPKLLYKFKKLLFHSKGIVSNYIDVIEIDEDDDVLLAFNNFLDLWMSFVKTVVPFVKVHIDFFTKEVDNNMIAKLERKNETIRKNNLSQVMIQFFEQNLYSIVRQLGLVHNLSPDDFFLQFSTAGIILYCSLACMKRMGFKLTELVGSSVECLVVFQDQNVYHSLLQNKCSEASFRVTDNFEQPVPLICFKFNNNFLCFAT